MQAPTVLHLLHSAQMRVTMLTLLVVGVVLTLGTGVLMKVSTQRNLELQARSVAYSVEAAVLFQDPRATQSLLGDLLAREPIAQAWIDLGEAPAVANTDLRAIRPFVHYVQPRANTEWQAVLMRVWPMYASAPIVAQRRVLGQVRLQADATVVLQMLGWSLTGIVVGMALTGLAVAHFSRKLAERLVNPLQALANHTREVRAQGTPERRAPRSGVQELDQLSSDFDTLIDELQAHQSELLLQNDELKSAHDQLAVRVREDTLTGAATRAYFEDSVSHAVQRAKAAGTRLALLYVDADRFKAINDQYGHDAGDKVLVALVQRLKGAVREQDLVGRLGGDEFAVLVQTLRETADATRLAEQLHNAVAKPLALHGDVVIIPSVSVGAAVFPDQGSTVAALMQEADQSMYLKKRAGRGESSSPVVDQAPGSGRRIRGA